ncbi:unnamed protein product [Clonostachys solani]|uniref:Uncharacterized protein n=1 Tax=Clonostachys solani TaxID=160281 RepID=A0A9N9YU26_9HYPO|nr:unnamed protein product [Clonostachys solani]
MPTPLQRLAKYGIVPEDWPHASSFEDLPSVYQELFKTERMEQAFIRDQQTLQSNDELEDKPEALWVVAAYHFTRQREALCSRANFIDAGKVKATKLTDLSTELLLMIVQNFQYSAPLVDGLLEEDVVPPFPHEDRHAVQSLRLVSHLFNDLASPLLCPVVHLTVDQDSFLKVRRIMKNPLLASGVRAFSIGLEYRPTRLARDFRTWLGRYREGIGARLLSSEISQNACRLKTTPAPCAAREAELQEESIVLRDAWRRAKLFGAAEKELRCRTYVGDDPLYNGLFEEDIAEYKHLILGSHAAFALAYDLQARLISTKQFAKAVGKLAAKAGRPVALELFERTWNLPKRGKYETRTVFRSEQVLRDFLSADVGWYMELHAEGNIRREMPISLIADLPLQIHRAKGVLAGFQLRCPPLPHHIDVLVNTELTDWRWLSDSFRHLKVLRIPRLCVEDEDRFNLISTPRKCIYRWFFTALLSAPCLNEVSLEGHIYTRFLHRLKLSGTVLSSLRGVPPISASPQLKRIHLSSVAPSQLHIAGLARRLKSAYPSCLAGDSSMDMDVDPCKAMDLFREKLSQSRETSKLYKAPSKDVDPRKAVDLLREKLSRSRIPNPLEADAPEADRTFYLNIVSEEERSLADDHPELWSELAAYMEGERLNGTPVWMWTINYW